VVFHIFVKDFNPGEA